MPYKSSVQQPHSIVELASSSPDPYPFGMNLEEAKNTISEPAWKLISQGDSLSQYLRQKTNNVIEHRLLFEGWETANAVECQKLQLSSDERTWVRLIEWRIKNRLWIFARVILPETTLKASNGLLPHIGLQSLGDILFKDPDLQRSEFSFLQISHQGETYSLPSHLITPESPIWARQSVFTFQKQPLLITEIFLPESYA